MPFRIEPQEIPEDFIWASRLYHLTYSHHIDWMHVKQTVCQATSVPLEGYSLAQERSVHLHDDGTTADVYEHTHVALIFKARLGLKGCRKFDVFVPDPDTGVAHQYHPNIQPKVNMVQMETIFTSYHAGRKYDLLKNKYRFEPPVLREFKLPPAFEFTAAILQDVINAPTLVDGCQAGAVRPRTVNDIKTLRDDAAGAEHKKFKHKFPFESFTLSAPPFQHALHIYGASGIGKTKWAVAQFKCPLLVKPFNSVGCLESISKRFDPAFHDGIVLDEADLRFMTREQVIAFLDTDEEVVIDVRFKSFRLPEGVKKILVSNPEPKRLYPTDNEFGAIARRIVTLLVDRKTWAPRPPDAAVARQFLHAMPTANFGTQ